MIITGDEVKEKLLQGINLVANTVKPTLGPQAKTVILQNDPPIVINDGVTITKYVSHHDPYVQMGIQMVQNLASKAQEGSGDGTTTACILAQALCQEINRLPVMNAHEFYRLLNDFKVEMLKGLDKLSIKIEDDDILNVATIAANNDPNLGALIQAGIEAVGREGALTVEESKTHITELVIREGMQIPEGYISHLMANQPNGKAVFENPLVFMSNMKFRNFKDLIGLLEYSANQSRPLVIFCKGMDGSALNNLLANIINKNVDCAVVLAPNFGDQQLDELGDIQCMIGGKVFTEESKDSASQFVAGDLGQCERIIISKERTVLIGGEGDSTDRINYLKEQVKTMEGFDSARIKSRIVRLRGRVATIKVGASSSMEMLEKKERLDDALNATRAALEEGIVVGGGRSLIEAAYNNTNAPEWLKSAMVSPYETLLTNSNMHFEEFEAYPHGFNALTGEMCMLNEAGVFDPVKVTKNSFLAAMSIAQLFYSTEVAVLVEE
jgi:chaperonin GroEL